MGKQVTITADGADRDVRGPSGVEFEAFLDLTPTPAWVYDAATFTLVAANDAACSLYGYRREDLLGLSVFDLCVEEERDLIGRKMADPDQVNAAKEIWSTMCSDGRIIKVMMFLRRASCGGSNCIIACIIDFTEQKNASLELKRTKIFLDAVVESIPSMVFVKDAVDGRFVLLNEAGENLLQIKREELIGRTDFDLFDPTEAERFRTADREVVALGKLVTIDKEPLTTPEGIRLLRTQKVGVPDINGNPRYLLGISEDVTEKVKMEERNKHLALHDILTNLPNRTAFFDNLSARLKQHNQRTALLFVDLDGFKRVNDTRGHKVGDVLLKLVARRFEDFASATGAHVSRLGGDEFASVLACPDAKEAGSIALGLIRRLSEPYDISLGQRVHISASVGVALSPEHGLESEVLLWRADLALYASKASGRGQVSIFSDDMEDEMRERNALEISLRQALEDQANLFVFYQPIVDIETGETTAREALIRWHEFERGWVPPAIFIPIAEQSDLIDELSFLVLNRACRDALSWTDNARVAVNMSARQLGKGTLANTVLEALAASGLSPKRLEIEITETALLVNEDQTLADLRQLRAMGVRVALDDFGTGYSSLSHLRAFPFDKIKIDGSFVADAVERSDCAAVVKSIAELGRMLGVRTVAEGVENQAQMDCVRRLGCCEMQGHLIGKAVPEAKDRLRVAELDREPLLRANG
ncbi:MAG: EAL domain-containing protein [Candidatus Andeanibacterium colombiense]|uniref:EAL domain-containing protein n=1 Tax=Candidatus Andeanibacterium colombiense TaxID=3121345 RepID=A0AAJ5X8Z3_9SPHN|nr:MAG: EAL domain-containing protein [Sphingomonadaceae bacterium]